MTEYDDELQHGRALATTTATASADLDREAQRIGAIAGKPVLPDTESAARDATYRTAWRREEFASQMLWTLELTVDHFCCIPKAFDRPAWDVVTGSLQRFPAPPRFGAFDGSSVFDELRVKEDVMKHVVLHPAKHLHTIEDDQ